MSKARSLADFIEADGSATIDGLTVGQGAGNVATNTAVGASALAANTTGASNTAIGINALDANTTGNSNTAVGESALTSNVTGERNTAMGRESLKNTTSSENTAFGNEALKLNSSGAYNTAVGSFALNVNTTASYNTAVGYQASYSNTTGINNVAVGYLALANSTTANFNVAVGKGAGSNITTGSYNYLVGRDTGGSITTGIFNHGFGVDCLATVTDGGYNVGMGSSALRYTTGSQNTAVGQQAGKEITTGSKNTILGRYNGNQGGLDIRTSSNRIVLSDGDGVPVQYIRNASTFVLNEWRHSAGSIAGSLSFGNSYNEASSTDALLKGYMGGDFHIVAQSNGVYLTNGATSWTSASDERVKDIIENIDNAVTKVNGLRAVIGKYKTDDEAARRAFLIAQDVQAVLPEAVTQKDDDIGTLGVAYTDIIPLLVAAIKEQTQTITALEARIAALESN